MTALSLIDQDPTEDEDRGLSVADVERILDKLDDLDEKISKQAERLSEVIQWQRLREESIAKFYEQDWAPLQRRVSELEKKVWTAVGLAVAVSLLLEKIVKL